MTASVAPYMRHGVQLDTVVVEGLQVSARHGILPDEKTTPQPFLVDVVAHLDTRPAGRSDDPSKTIDYAWIAKVAAGVVAGDSVGLIETLADKIAIAVLESEKVEAVDVTVHKPQAPVGLPVSDLAITIRRDVKGGDLWSDKRIGSAAGLADDPQSPDAVPPPRDALDGRPGQASPVLLGIGGNIGDVEYTLARAIEDLTRVEGLTVTAVSPLVETAAVGGPEQPSFLNAVVRLYSLLAPRALLHVCQGIEMIHGREREVINGPRTLDIDVIAYGDVASSADDLQIPHPRAHERAFVLAPWAAMEPDAVLPTKGRVADLAQAAPDAAGLRVARNPWNPQAVVAARQAQASAQPGE